MTNADAYMVICQSLKSLGVQDSQLCKATALAELGLESLHVLQMLFELEQYCNIKIPDDQLYGFETIGDIVTYLEAYACTGDASSG